MSNNRKTFTLTDAATAVIESIPSSFRAKFVSDAITALSKKKGIADEYNITKPGVNKASRDNEPSKSSQESESAGSTKPTKKSKSDPRFG